MELVKPSDIPVNNCHQQIFRELDQLRQSINDVKHTKTLEANSHCYLSKNRNTASTNSIKKVTQVRYHIAPGIDELKYEGRHHLDDSEMKRVLHWSHVPQDSDSVEDHEAHRQTFKHPKPVEQSPRYVFQNKKQQIKKNGLKIQRLQTEKPQLRKVTSVGILAKMNPESKIHKLVETDKRNYASKQMKSQIDQVSSYQSQKRQLNNTKKIQTQPFEEEVYRQNKQRTHFNDAYDRSGRTDQYQLTQFNQYQTGQQSNRSQEASKRRTGSLRRSNRKEGYVVTRQRLKLVTYDDITASSDSYFSPYEDQI